MYWTYSSRIVHAYLHIPRFAIVTLNSLYNSVHAFVYPSISPLWKIYFHERVVNFVRINRRLFAQGRKLDIAAQVENPGLGFSQESSSASGWLRLLDFHFHCQQLNYEQPLSLRQGERGGGNFIFQFVRILLHRRLSRRDYLFAREFLLQVVSRSQF